MKGSLPSALSLSNPLLGGVPAGCRRVHSLQQCTMGGSLRLILVSTISVFYQFHFYGQAADDAVGFPENAPSKYKEFLPNKYRCPMT